MDHANDSALIQRLLAGEEKAYRQLVAAYHGGMLAFARSFVGEAIADEVVQESWLSMIKALPKFEQRSSLKTWLYTIVGNCARSRLRKENRTISFADPVQELTPVVDSERFAVNHHWSHGPVPWENDTPEALLASEQLKQHLDQAIAALPLAQQSILVLRDQQGLAMEEICKILEISESNARVLLHRARARLWTCIEEFEKGKQ